MRRKPRVARTKDCIMSTRLTHQTNISNTNQSAPAPEDSERWRLAFERLESEIRALPESELVTINLDVQTASTTVGGSLKEILPLRDQIAKLHGVDISKLDKLRDYTDALLHTQLKYRAAIGPTDPVTKLAAEVTAVRDQLHIDAHALATRGLLDLASVEKLRSPSGHRNIATDVGGLVLLFRENAATLANRTPVTEPELKNAMILSQRLMDAVGDRDQAPNTTADATLVRQKAYSLFVNAYDEVRRAIGYLRWHEGDAESIAPSLFAGRMSKRPEITPDAPTPNTTVPNSTGPVTNAPIPGTSDSIPVGLPGSNPFTK